VEASSDILKCEIEGVADIGTKALTARDWIAINRTESFIVELLWHEGDIRVGWCEWVRFSGKKLRRCGFSFATVRVTHQE
jgi:hypothetical protein